VPPDFGRIFRGAGVVAAGFAGSVAEEPPEGALEKKPNNVLWPPEEGVFFRAGVEEGVEELFLAMLMVRRTTGGPKSAYTWSVK
jgi:hypothetical protein